MENVIEVCDVNKYFGEEHVLKSVSHTFEKGKIHGIVGNNGSGKTVLMKCICFEAGQRRDLCQSQAGGEGNGFPGGYRHHH